MCLSFGASQNIPRCAFSFLFSLFSGLVCCLYFLCFVFVRHSFFTATFCSLPPLFVLFSHRRRGTPTPFPSLRNFFLYFILFFLCLCLPHVQHCIIGVRVVLPQRKHGDKKSEPKKKKSERENEAREGRKGQLSKNKEEGREGRREVAGLCVHFTRWRLFSRFSFSSFLFPFRARRQKKKKDGEKWVRGSFSYLFFYIKQEGFCFCHLPFSLFSSPPLPCSFLFYTFPSPSSYFKYSFIFFLSSKMDRQGNCENQT